MVIITDENQQDRDCIKVGFNQDFRGVSLETEYEKQSSWAGNNSSGRYTLIVPLSTFLADIELVNGSSVIDKVQSKINLLR